MLRLYGANPTHYAYNHRDSCQEAAIDQKPLLSTDAEIVEVVVHDNDAVSAQWECDECAHMNKAKWKRCGNCGNPAPDAPPAAVRNPVAVRDATSLTPTLSCAKPREDVQQALAHQKDIGFTPTPVGGPNDDGHLGDVPENEETTICNPCCFGVCHGCCSEVTACQSLLGDRRPHMD